MTALPYELSFITRGEENCVYSLSRNLLTDPLPSNGHIHHNIFWRICPKQELLNHRNAHNNRITGVYSSLLGNGQRANEITQWEPREMFSVRSAWSLYNATLVVFEVSIQLMKIPDETAQFPAEKSEVRSVINVV
jgi:hypothetical protein